LAIASWIDVPNWPMSELSTYLRNQASKCRRHANALSDTQAQEELRKPATEYTGRAAGLERTELA